MTNVEATVTLRLTGSCEHDYTLVVATRVEKPFHVDCVPVIVCTCSSRAQVKTLLSILRSAGVTVEIGADVQKDLCAGEEVK